MSIVPSSSAAKVVILSLSHKSAPFLAQSNRALQALNIAFKAAKVGSAKASLAVLKVILRIFVRVFT